MTRGIATLAALMAVIPLLAGCAERFPAAASAGDACPILGSPPRVREPSSARPPWLSAAAGQSGAAAGAG